MEEHAADFHLRRVLFYDDSAEYGGHQAMTLQALRWLLTHTVTCVDFLYYVDNARLNEPLQELAREFPALRLHSVAQPSRGFQGFRTYLARRTLASLTAQMQALAPDMVVVVQGTIEISSLGLLAARKSGLRVVSYIPFARPLAGSGTRLGWLRDLTNRRLYRQPDGFITSGQYAEQDLRRQGVKTPVHIAYPGLDLSRYHPMDCNEARCTLGLPPEKRIVGMVARVLFLQKRHDWLAATWAAHRTELADCHLVIVGDGPDLPELRRLVERNGLNDCVTFLSWRGDLSPVYSACDALVIPSRFEGMPGVMLEAMYFGRPVVASGVDGMREVLPASWQFPPDEATAFVHTLGRVLTTDQNVLTVGLQQRVRETFNQEAFGRSFADALR